jgi:dienelactone hydrolase
MKPWFSCKAALLAALLALVGAAQAQVNAGPPQLYAALGEQVVMVPHRGNLFNPELETTLYRPPGDGPFPVVVINHGKMAGDVRFQARYQPVSAARFFLARGYAVVVPMRSGFSKSSGSYIGGGCNVESNGRVQAEDVKAVLDWLGEQAWADRRQVLLVGQSHGGWTTLAAGAAGVEGVEGVVNFAGGLRNPDCSGWEGTLARAAGSYGKQVRVPSLWFYGENDSFFPERVWKAMADAYAAGGAPVDVVNTGSFGADSHFFFGARAAERVWQPKVNDFMAAAGLPTAVRFPELLRAAQTPVPPASGFAALDDVDKVPFLKPSGREGYKAFLAKQLPRAFAIGPSGAWAWSEMGDDPLARALANCQRHAKTDCKLYAVDDQVVWKE